MPTDFRATPARTHTGLVEVLDKGLIVASDIRVSLAEVELLTHPHSAHDLLDRQGRGDRTRLVEARPVR